MKSNNIQYAWYMNAAFQDDDVDIKKRRFRLLHTLEPLNVRRTSMQVMLHIDGALARTFSREFERQGVRWNVISRDHNSCVTINAEERQVRQLHQSVSSEWFPKTTWT